MNRDWRSLRPRVLSRIKPTQQQTQRALETSKRLMVRILAAARPYGIPTEPVLVGSLAKRTHLRPRPDIDLFMLFPTSLPREQLERVGLAIGRKVLQDATTRYAEHPYVRGRFGGFAFDVVPAYRVASGAGKMSAVDRSPFHAAYVRRHLRTAQRDEVRLLKQFLKGIGCYGAETATGGFSGYLAELLILRYGTFWDTLQSARGWTPPVRLALEGEAPPLGGDLVFVDPVDPARNAAAAVQPARLALFRRAADAFVQAPSTSFFWPPPPRPVATESLRTMLQERSVIGLEVPTPKVAEQARLPHLRRFAEKATRRLAEEGFQTVRDAVIPLSSRRTLLLWEHTPPMLQAEYVHQGPPPSAGPHAQRFLEKWTDHPAALAAPRNEGGRWTVRVRRRHRDGLSVLNHHLHELSEGLALTVAARRRLRVKPGSELARKRTLRRHLAAFAAPRDPWDAR